MAFLGLSREHRPSSTEWDGVLAKDNLAYYNATRPHQALHNNSPHPSEVQAPEGGRIVAIPQVGGLHHRYQRAA